MSYDTLKETEKINKIIMNLMEDYYVKHKNINEHSLKNNTIIIFKSISAIYHVKNDIIFIY